MKCSLRLATECAQAECEQAAREFPAAFLAVQEMLRQLRHSTGLWHTLASYLPHLARAGYDTTALEADTGLERVRQSVWTVAVQVPPEAVVFSLSVLVRLAATLWLQLVHFLHLPDEDDALKRIQRWRKK